MASDPTITVHLDTRRLRITLALLRLAAVVVRWRPAGVDVRLESRPGRRGEVRLVAVPIVHWRHP